MSREMSVRTSPSVSSRMSSSSSMSNSAGSYSRRTSASSMLRRPRGAPYQAPCNGSHEPATTKVMQGARAGIGLSVYRYMAAGVRLRTTARERCDGALPGLIPHAPSLDWPACLYECGAMRRWWVVRRIERCRSKGEPDFSRVRAKGVERVAEGAP